MDKVIVLWTANTERFCDVVPGLNDTADNLLRAIEVRGRGGTVGGGVEGMCRSAEPRGVPAARPGGVPIHAVRRGSILEGCAYINGSPQNTFVPGAVELAAQRRVFICGDDFKSGQTKLKSVLVDFLVGAGLKVRWGGTWSWADLSSWPPVLLSSWPVLWDGARSRVDLSTTDGLPTQ